MIQSRKAGSASGQLKTHTFLTPFPQHLCVSNHSQANPSGNLTGCEGLNSEEESREIHSEGDRSLKKWIVPAEHYSP